MIDEHPAFVAKRRLDICRTKLIQAGYKDIKFCTNPLVEPKLVPMMEEVADIIEHIIKVRSND